MKKQTSCSNLLDICPVWARGNPRPPYSFTSPPSTLSFSIFCFFLPFSHFHWRRPYLLSTWTISHNASRHRCSSHIPRRPTIRHTADAKLSYNWLSLPPRWRLIICQSVFQFLTDWFQQWTSLIDRPCSGCSCLCPWTL